MTLTRLALHNYMTHRDLTADFDGNLIALTGEMGHGKSTFVGAIQFCLTGEHPPWHREDLLSWGTDEGSAKLYFTQDGIDCSILRKLHSSEVVLRLGEETVTGAKNVEKALATRLGVDKDILKQIGFVQQYEVQSILFDDPSKRERSFQKLLGIGDASKIWTELGPIIQSYSRSENFDASIESLKREIDKLDQDLEGVDQTLKSAEESLKLLPARERQTAEIERLTKIQACIQQLTDTRKCLDELNTQSAQRMNELSEHMAALKKLKADLGSVEDLEKFVTELKDAHAKVLADYTSLMKLSGASDKDGHCPLCGTAVQAGSIKSHVEGELKRLKEATDKAHEEYAKNADFLRSIKEQIANAERLVQLDETAIANTATSISIHKLQEKTCLENFARLGTDPAVKMDDLARQVQEDLSVIRSLGNQYDDLSRQIAALQGERRARKAVLGQNRKELEDKIKEKELSAPLARKVEVLTNVRNWFHSSNGPRTMSVSAVKALTGFVNEYLQALHSEIEVMASDDGFSFVFRYLDGRPVSDPLPSTAKLSGGQKICLALAFRLAIYRCFGAQMGIMVLDEPTAHLSPAGITYFGELLKTVSTLAKNMNLQIIMPTHEKEIMPFMDSEIHFD